MNFGSVLTSLRKSKGYSRQKFIDLFNSAYPDNTISIHTYIKYETTGVNPTYDTLANMADFYGVSIDYLFNHTPPPLNPYAYIPAEDKEKAVIEAFVKLDPSTRQAILAAMDALIADPTFRAAIDKPEQEQEEINEIVHTIFVRFFPDTVSAGTGTDLLPDSGNAEIMAFKKTSAAEKADFAVRVRGDSMIPTFNDDDIVFVKKQPVEIGEIGVFQMDGEGYIKELGDKELISHNPEYPPIPATDDLSCKGKVIGIAEPV